jgi:hypothetical protein
MGVGMDDPLDFIDISAANETWVERIKSEVLNVADLDDLAVLDAAEVVDRLSELYPVRFLEVSRRSLAAMTCLRVRRLPGSHDRWKLTSGAEFNLYHDPDGWRQGRRLESCPRKSPILRKMKSDRGVIK